MAATLTFEPFDTEPAPDPVYLTERDLGTLNAALRLAVDYWSTEVTRYSTDTDATGPTMLALVTEQRDGHAALLAKIEEVTG